MNTLNLHNLSTQEIQTALESYMWEARLQRVEEYKEQGKQTSSFGFSYRTFTVLLVRVCKKFMMKLRLVFQTLSLVRILLINMQKIVTHQKILSMPMFLWKNLLRKSIYY
mgnify:CR=1 FL=1